VLVECVVNVSEGRDETVLTELAVAAGPSLLDRHSDSNHHRSVFTLVGPANDVAGAARALATVCVARLDLSGHRGVHPRLGVLDVVPFVPYRPDEVPSATEDLGAAAVLRDDFARWLGATFAVPSFLYGPLPDGQIRTLPQVRRHSFADLPPDFEPPRSHPTAGATAVGARAVLVAYNVWVSSLATARGVVPQVRSQTVRALALQVGDRAQVSCNLTDPGTFGPDLLYDAVTELVGWEGGTVVGAELVGLIPRAVLAKIAPSRWDQLGLSDDATVEARLPG
jgi:glutamate formiminotransferase / 5-formyltetrahydrofolate cyclo-ligase